MFWSNVVRRTPVALLCVTGVLLCAFALSMPGASAAPVEGDVVGVTRSMSLDDGTLLTVTALVDRTVREPEQVLDELLPGSAAGSDDATAQFALWRKWSSANIPVPVSYNFEWDIPGRSAFDSLQWSMAQWNNVAGQSFRFRYAGSTSVYSSQASCTAQRSDGVNSVRLSYILPSGTLGVTCAIAGPGFVDGVRQIVEFDMQLDGGEDWSTAAVTPGNRYDLHSTVLHELGHALGLNHTSFPGGVMTPFIGAGEQTRVITSDDAAGIRALYGTAAPRPPPTPTTPAAVTVTPTATATPKRTATPMATASPAVPAAGNSFRMPLPGLAFDGTGGPPPPPAFTPPPSATPVPPTSTPTPTRTPATATPTWTPTRTPTPFATATPTRTPIPPPSTSGFSTRRSSWYVSTTGTIWVVGEVANETNQSMSYVKVVADFYSASGQLLASDFGFATIDVLAPGGDSPYTILLLNPPPGITNVSVRVTDWFPSRIQPARGLSATVTNSYTNSIGTLHIVGTVRNDSTVAYDYVQPIVALYDGTGSMVRTDFTFTKPSTLQPGQSATFDLLVLNPVPFATYRIWVDGLP